MNMNTVSNLITTAALSDVLVFVNEYITEYPGDTKKEFIDALLQYLMEKINSCAN